jgi:hypothetical protein
VVEPSGEISDHPWKGAAAPAAAAAAAAGGGGGKGGGGGGGGGKETVLVVFLGGATFSEVSALRFLQSRPGATVRFAALATRLVNGRTLLEGFVDAAARAFPSGGGGGGGGAAAV